MASYTVWLYLLPFFLGTWMAIARETRLSISCYILQTACVAALYGIYAWKSSDPGLWVSFAGICEIRMILIPLLLRKLFKGSLLTSRDTEYVITPPFAIVVYFALGIVSLRLGNMLTMHSNGLYFGLSLAVVLVGLSAIAICHHVPKQIMGVLCADNGIDLAAIITLQRISAVSDYMIFTDVAIAVLCFAIIVRRLRTIGYEHSHRFHDLRG